MLKTIFNALHAYVYGRWTKQYVSVLRERILPRLSPQGKKKLSDGYHGKVLTHEHAKAIISIKQNISRRDLEQIIPYPQARTLVLKAPPDIVVYECACRRTRANHCDPKQVCMMIGRPVTDFILKYHPCTSRRISQAEALDLLREEHERGHFHAAWFKEAVGGRLFAICNCCKCCCFGIEAMMAYGTPMVASSGYMAVVEENTCTACGMCRKACPFDAISMQDSSVVHWDKCMGCGVCAGQCPREALSLVRDDRKGIPLDVRLLAKG